MTSAWFAADTVGLIGTIVVFGFLFLGLRSLRNASPATGSQQLRDAGFVTALTLLTVIVTAVIAAVTIHQFNVPRDSAKEFVVFMAIVCGGSSTVGVGTSIMLGRRRRDMLSQKAERPSAAV